MSGAAVSGSAPPLREGRAAEAEALAALHVEVWRATYRDIATPEALTQLDEARRLPYWRRALGAEDEGVIVAEGAGGAGAVQGVVSYGPGSHPAFAGRAEIKHLYVRHTARGAGLGRRLLTGALEAVRETGAAGAALAVVAENAAARRFYAAMGGAEVGAFVDPGPLWRSSNIVVAWAFDP